MKDVQDLVTYILGLKTGTNGRIVNVSFVDEDKIVPIDTTFHESDRGSKLIAPTLWNAYLEPVDPSTNIDEFDSAKLVGYPGTRPVNPTNYNKESRKIGWQDFYIEIVFKMLMWK